MSEMQNKYRSSLSMAKNLGSAGKGSDHWMKQRITAIMMVILTAWMVCFIAKVSHATTIASFIDILQAPYNSAVLMIFIPTALYHSSIGMQVIFEDYIKCRVMRVALVIMIKILVIVTAVSFAVSLIYIMSL
ncbi:MAG: hypothetical protein DGJ47_000323 [Rickettsiaceae bacterium]